MKFLSRFIIVGILGGISLSMAVGLLAASAWLISMASTQPPILTLQVAVVSVRFFGLGRGVFRYAERIYGHDAILRAASRLQILLYQSLIKREPVSSFAMREGKLLQQITTDIEVVQDRWIRIFIPAISVAISVWAGIGVIYWLAPTISITVLVIYLATITLIVLVSAGFSRRHSAAIFQSETEMSDTIADTSRGFLEAEIYGYQSTLKDSLFRQEAAIIASEKRLITNAGLSNSILLTGAFTSIVISFLMGLNAINDGSLADINLAVLTLLPLAIFDGTASLIAPLSQYGKIATAKQNIDEITSVADVANPGAHLESGTVMVKAVAARGKWKNSELQHQPLSFVIKSGEAMVIRGESGLGKSSFALAIAGLVDYEGSIRLNGIEVRDINRESLHEAMTVSLQDDHLFATSILENLRIANPDATIDDVMRALKKVELTELISNLPEGIDTHVGAFGRNFSGGELQRLRLARVFLRKTPLYILDEPFEHLNSDLGERILARLKEHFINATVLIISHEEIVGISKELLLIPNYPTTN